MDKGALFAPFLTQNLTDRQILFPNGKKMHKIVHKYFYIQSRMNMVCDTRRNQPQTGNALKRRLLLNSFLRGSTWQSNG